MLTVSKLNFHESGYVHEYGEVVIMILRHICMISTQVGTVLHVCHLHFYLAQ